MIYQTQRADFIETLSKNESAIFFFYTEEDKNSVTVKKVKAQLKDLAGDSQDINIHLFITDQDEDTKEFSAHLELDTIPTIVVYKNGSFSRYKNKDFTSASIKKFIGNGSKVKKQQPLEV